MFINIDNENLLKDYLNSAHPGPSNSHTSKVLEPKEGLVLGNMFLDLYKPYKHHKPKELIGRTEQESLMLKIRELSFAINDLCLYLDLYPHDIKVGHIYKQYLVEVKRLQGVYSQKYQPLCLEEDLENGFSWGKGPWPWEVKNV